MDKTRQPLRSWLRNEPEIKERSAMASSEHTATTPVDARNSLVESPRDTEISDTTLAPTTMTSDPPIPSFNYMFEGEEESSDDELPDPTKCDSKFLRFEDLRVKERGNYFEASFTQAMHGSLVDDARIACEFLQRETDAEAASLHSSMAAGIALASTSIVHLPAATREERVLGAPVIGYSWSTKTTPTPSEIAKTKSAGQSLCRVRANIYLPPTPKTTSLCHKTKLWFKRRPSKICHAFSRREIEEMRCAGTTMMHSSVHVIEDEDERGRWRSRWRSRSSSEISASPTLLPEKEGEIMEVAAPREEAISDETSTMNQANGAQEYSPGRSSPKLPDESENPEMKSTTPVTTLSKPDRQRSFRSGTPVVQEPRVNLWSRKNQGRRTACSKNKGAWNAKWWVF